MRRAALFGYSLSGSEVLALGALLGAREARAPAERGRRADPETDPEAALPDRLAIVAVSPGPIRAPRARAAASGDARFAALAEEFDPDKDARKDQIARIRQRLQMAQAEAAAEAMRGGPGRDM